MNDKSLGLYRSFRPESRWRNKSEMWYRPSMDEGRKRTILIGACILVSRKFGQLGPQSSPALEAAISDAVVMGERDPATH
jgi:hypothetical protein